MSLLERSSATPIGTESSIDSVIGNVGLRVSSKSSVVVNTPLIKLAGWSLVSGVLDLLNSPISEEAVDDTMSRS